jgi:hypothetical protein
LQTDSNIVLLIWYYHADLLSNSSPYVPGIRNKENIEDFVYPYQHTGVVQTKSADHNYSNFDGP